MVSMVTTSGVGQFSIYGQHNSSPSTYGALGYYNYILPIALEYGVYGYSSSGLAGYFVGRLRNGKFFRYWS